MARRTTPEARKSRMILGLIISVVTFAVALPLTFGLLAERLDGLLKTRPLFGQGTASLLAGAAILIGLFWVTWSYSNIVLVGKGSPVEAFGRALEPTIQLVTSGPYAYLRHPMIFGFLWILLGVAFYLASVSG